MNEEQFLALSSPDSAIENVLFSGLEGVVDFSGSSPSSNVPSDSSPIS